MSILRRALRGGSERNLSLDDWASYFNYGGLSYPFLNMQQSLGGKTEDVEQSFAGYVQGAYKRNGVVFACITARQLLFSEARFQFRRMVNGRPGELFGNQGLAIVERPEASVTTRTMLSRAMQDADLGGNWFGVRRGRLVVNGRTAASGEDRLVRVRPDWMTILVGSRTVTDDPNNAIDAELAGYLYHPGGHHSGHDPITLLPEEVAHFAPIPDPAFRFRGMSWLTPILDEISADQSAMRHKRQFFDAGATINLAVTEIPARNPDEFQSWVAKFKQEHEGAFNEFKTLFLSKGADVKPIGSNLKDADFKTVMGAGETRVAAAARVPPVIVGLSEGLEATSYAHYSAARRSFADLTMRPLWGDMAGALARVVDVPDAAHLWYDDRDIPFLQEDVQDAATIQKTNSEAIRSLTDAGYDPKTVIDAVTSGDLTRLKHLGVFSVQLQAPGSGQPSSATNGNGNGNGAAPDDEDDAGRALRALLPNQ